MSYGRYSVITRTLFKCSDFIGRGNNREQAGKLIEQFEIRHEAAILDACRRGKEGRYRRNI